MPQRRIHRFDYLYVSAALATALLVQRADLSRPAPDASVTAAVLRPGLPEPEESFRLPPDRRFMLAVGDLHHLLSGAPEGAADARFEGGRWHITHGGIEVGTLPEVPDYPDLMALLTGWATLLGANGVINAPGIAGDPAPLESELRRFESLAAVDLADRRWSVGERGRGLFEVAARALVQIEVVNDDRVEASDLLDARALALLAACQALEPAALGRESCLLAHRLGYGAWALAQAGRLSPYDPVRAFVRGEDARLAALALERRADPDARFLELARASGTEPSGPLAELRAIEDELTSIGAGAAPDSEPGLHVAAGEEAPLPEVVNAFERRMEALPSPAGGFFLDPEVLKAYWRGRFYSAVLATLELPGLTGATGPTAPPAADPLAGVSAGVGAEFADWARHVIAGRSSAGNRAALACDLGTLPHFGAPLRFAAYEALWGRAPAPEIAPRRMAQRLAGRLDTRPAHRARFGRLAIFNLLALPLGEELLAGAQLAGAPMPCELEAWWAERTGDRAGLESMLSRSGHSPADQAAILDRYGALPGPDSAAVCGAYRRSIASHPGSWALVEGYARYLERQRAWVPARSSIHRWLERNADRAGLETIAARSLLARLYEDQGRKAEGFAAVASVVASQQPEAMATAVRLLDALGQGSQAETLAVFAAERASGTSAARAEAAELFWRHGKPGAAARLLATDARQDARDDWRAALGARFVRCFAARPAAGGQAADSLVVTGRIGAEPLADLAAAAADSGAWPLADEIESRVRPAPARRVEHFVSLYRALARTRGEAEATAWLAPRLQGARRAELIRIERLAFADQEDALLWSVCSDSTGPLAEVPWRLRAAAALRRGDHGGAHARELAWHFAAPDHGHDRTLGRFMLGLEDEATVLGLRGSAGEACEAYYVLGFKAQAEGRMRDAAAWYARALGTRQAAKPEYRWAFDQLAAWQRRGLSLERLEALEGRTPA